MPRGKDLFDDDFDSRFNKMWERNDRIFDQAEKALAHPVRTMILAGLAWLVGFIIVCAVIAFFVSLFI